MPAAAIPSICRHRSHLLPPWKRVPASFSFQLSHGGLDAFQEWRTDTSGKVSLGRQQQAPGKGICCLRTRGGGCQVGPTLWVRACREFDEQHHPTPPPTDAESSVKTQAWNGSGTVTKPPSFSPSVCGKDSSSKHWQPEMEIFTTAPCAVNLFALFSFQDTNNYENVTAKPPDSQQGAQLALSNWYLHLKTRLERVSQDVVSGCLSQTRKHTEVFALQHPGEQWENKQNRAKIMLPGKSQEI